MNKIIEYSEKYQEQYCALYITTWKIEPYGELFTREEIISHLVKNKDSLYLLLESDQEKVIGFVGGRPLNYECSFFSNDGENKIETSKAFYIDELGIAEDHKNKGWGTKLMNYIIDKARNKGFHQFVLRTHAGGSNPAIKLYKKLDFKQMKLKIGGNYTVKTTQNRIDNRSKSDDRIYFEKTYTDKLEK